MAELVHVLIMGAAGRDFHNFNVRYRGDASRRVVAFTATQIPNVENRRYPPELSGPLYPEGIPIVSESELEKQIAENGVREVVFSYSDISHQAVMHQASRALATGASFILLGPRETQIPSRKPVIAVTAVRTGCGKSPVSRHIAAVLREMGLRVAAVRHPMPYGDLLRQRSQRFSSFEDLDAAACTIEEREEYAPYIEAGSSVFAGVDYEEILQEAEAESDIIIWDGGNNDFSFFVPDLQITLVDPHRPGHEKSYHPGEANLLMADIVVVSKSDTAAPDQIEAVRRSVQEMNPEAEIIDAALPIQLESNASVQGASVLVIEDGPTVTHGGMPYGAGFLAARAAGANMIDPRPYAVGSLKAVYEKYENLGAVLPAMGYGEPQVKEMEETIARAKCDAIIIGTPIDLRRLMKIGPPAYRVRYTYRDRSAPGLGEKIQAWWKTRNSPHIDVAPSGHIQIQ